MRPKIAILCSDDAHHKYLIAQYSVLFDVVLIVMEPSKSQRRSLLKEGKIVDYLYCRYHQCRRTVQQLDKYRRQFFDCSFDSRYYDIHIVSSVNDEKVLTLIGQCRPDIVVVICTSIIKGKVLQAIKGKAINIHGGYLPYYRGNHCFFFALYNREYDKIGSTIHFIDNGIDTGDIIEHVIPDIMPSDIPETLYCKAEKLAIHRLASLIQQYEDVSMIPRARQAERRKLYRTRDRGLALEFRFWYMRQKHHRFSLNKRTAPK